MSEKIYTAVSHDFIRRMRNWALYEAGYGRGGYGSIYELGAAVDRYRETAFVVLCGEAEDTKAALEALPLRYGEAVKQFWRYEGRAMRWHGRRRGVFRETFEAWVLRGHELLRDQLAKRTQSWRERAAQSARLQFRA